VRVSIADDGTRTEKGTATVWIEIDGL